MRRGWEWVKSVVLLLGKRIESTDFVFFSAVFCVWAKGIRGERDGGLPEWISLGDFGYLGL